MSEDFETPFPPPLDPLGEYDQQREINHLRSTSEAKGSIAQIQSLLAPYTPQIVETTDGRRIEVLARDLGSVSPAGSLWDLEIVPGNTEKVRIRYPGTVSLTSAVDNSGQVTIEGLKSTFSVSKGDYLILECTPDLQVNLKITQEWEGFPYPVESKEAKSNSDLFVLKTYRYVLHHFLDAEEAEELDLFISEKLVARKLGFSSHLRFVLGRDTDKDGNVISTYELLPAVGSVR